MFVFIMCLFFGAPMVIGLIMWTISAISEHRIKIEMVKQGMNPSDYKPEDDDDL